MKVIRAGKMGYCMGVKRAVQLVEQTLEENPGKTIHTIGPIIHNRQVVENFVSRGVTITENIDGINAGDIAVIRAHGIAESFRKALEKKGVDIKDGTCPNVIASQKIVAKYSALGYMVYIVGDKNHGEIKCLAGSASSVGIIQTPEEAGNAEPPEKSVVISQTTIKEEEFDSVCDILKRKNPLIVIENTICRATELRQQALIKLLRQVEAVLIIGGRNSANTQRLFHTAENSGLPAWHIEGVFDIPEEIGRYSIVGLTAGASTPDYVIDETEEFLRRLG